MRYTALITFLVFALLLTSPTVASEGPPPKLQPKTYFSPSGEYSLYVDPSHLHGIGPGRYTLKRRGDTVWSKDVPFTFWEAVVSDDGRAAGYAYSHGFQGWGAPAGYGDLIVALIGDNGSEIARETTPRDDWGHTCPPSRHPSPRGILLQPDLGRFVIRLDAKPDYNVRDERWLLYSITDGKLTGDLAVAAPAGGERLWYMAADADAVPGTELSLVVWTRTAWRPSNASDEGIRLVLIDKDANEVWSQEWTTEFTGLEYFSPRYLKETDVTPAARFADNRFVYLSRARQAAVTFATNRGADGGWSVEEVGSTPEVVQIGHRPDPKVVAPAEPKPPAPTLVNIGSFPLGNSDTSDNLSVARFAFDDRSRCGFIPFRGDGVFELVLIDPASPDPVGSVLHLPLELAEVEGETAAPQVAWIGGDRWVIVQGFHNNSPSLAWIADLDSKTVSPIVGFSSPKPTFGHGVISGGETGFAVVGDYRSNEVVRYDSNGKRLWTTRCAMTQDAAIRPDGTLGVLVGVPGLILKFDRDGSHTGMVSIEAGFGSRPNYVVGLEPDEDGGWIVHDFRGQPPVVRLSADNTKRASFTPHFDDGRTFRLYGDVRRAPNGRLWTSDRASILRLTEDGTVDMVIGAKPDNDTLGEIRAVTVDRAGRIYALDGHTAAVHVFDSSGRRTRILRPDPTDFPTDCGIGSITIAGDGEVYSRPTSIGPGKSRYLSFDAAGNRVGLQPCRSDDVSEEWFFRPGTQECVVVGYERAFLYDADQEMTRTLERRADQLWLDYPFSAAVAPDGSFAILARAPFGSGGIPSSVTLFSAAGDALETHELPEESIIARAAASDHAVAVVSQRSLLYINRTANTAKTYTIPGDPASGSLLVPFFSPDAGELWLIDQAKHRVDRYKAPSE
ncbi:MAG: hypothetical protein KF745_00185 [Phycisphaeraceae bacterium]|nr:hypothetical protein [Phycisphaeraceae bacterium]